MSQTYTGEVRNGVVVLETEHSLEDGTLVRVEPIVAQSPETPTLAERYAAIIGIIDDLPPDMAEQHDHYIHGTPRREVQ